MTLAIILPAVLTAILLTAGCQEKDLASQDRKSKLTASTTVNLKRQLDAKNKEMASQAKLLTNCKKQRDNSIAKLEDELADLKEKTKKQLAEKLSAETAKQSKILANTKKKHDQIVARLTVQTARQGKLLADTKKKNEQTVAAMKTQINKLKKELSKKRDTILKEHVKTSTETIEKLLEIFGESQLEIMKLQTENAKLKKQIEAGGQ
jgi:hypothetical protein